MRDKLVDPTTRLIEAALTVAQTVPREALADFLGALERIRVTALARLIALAPTRDHPDELLDVKAASRVLGCSVDYLYHHHHRFPLYLLDELAAICDFPRMASRHSSDVTAFVETCGPLKTRVQHYER